MKMPGWTASLPPTRICRSWTFRPTWKNSPWLPIITKARIAAKLRKRKGGLDPHVWTSPENVKIMAQSIYETLAAIDPAHQADFQANLDSFTADIDQLEADINANLSGITSKKFIVFHPAWGYFARDFGLEQIAIEIGGSEPSAQELAGIIDEAKAENVKVIFGAPGIQHKNRRIYCQ